MADKQKIGIVGLGLIGGSLALALGDRFAVYGYDKDKATREHAATDKMCTVVDSLSGLKGAALVFVCVPISVMTETLDSLCDLFGDETVITDVASVKLPFAGTKRRYVGGHPMAGTERGGITAAKPHLFENAYWVITSRGKDADTVKNTVESIGAIPLFMTAEEHDRAVAAFSHVPHAAAYALTAAATDKLTAPIAGSGFLDTTRIAKSDGRFWSDVFMLNRKNVSDGIKALIYELDALDKMIEQGDRAAVEKYLCAARNKREALDRVDLGGEALYVDLVDRVGEFERVTGAVARAGISVKNIALVAGREGASGALRLEFETAEDRNRAQSVLSASEPGAK